jgi:hypothetical protein
MAEDEKSIDKGSIDHVSPMDDSLPNSPIHRKFTSAAQLTAITCAWNGVQYAYGTYVCDDHNQYRCLEDEDAPGTGKWEYIVGDC